MIKDPQVFLLHIRDSIEQIDKTVEDLSEEDFLENVTIQDAVVRRIEIIGEAVKNLPADFKLAHPDVPWIKISGMRNKLIHEYFKVDVEMVWEVITNDLPELKDKVKKLLML